MNRTLEQVLFYLLDGNNPLYITIIGLFFIIISVVSDLIKTNKKKSNISSLISESGYSTGEAQKVTAAVQKKITGSPGSSRDIPLLSEKLSNSRNTLLSNLRNFFSTQNDSLSRESNAWFQSFEELLIEGDMGVKTSKKIIASIKSRINTEEVSDVNTELIQNHLSETMFQILHSDELPEINPEKVAGKQKIILVVGVNGAGKTTTIGKLAFQYQAQGAKVLIAACDTFRAAAANQLEVWKERANAEIEKGADGEKPSTVAYRAIHRASKENFDVLLIDTAGRLHTRANLMKELSGILSIINREQEGAPHETILVVDGSTGQNALQQAREFNDVTSLSGIVITKLDGTPKGGIVVAIKDELDIPIRYIGVGESVADLRPFDPVEFIAALLGTGSLTKSQEVEETIEVFNRSNISN